MTALSAKLTRRFAPAPWIPGATRRRRVARGFTLVELLVVITIIIALAGLIFTLSGNAKRSAIKVREMNNIRNISHLVIQYQTDKNLLPGAVNRGIKLPSFIPDGSRANWLSTVLIDDGFLGNDDEIWKTTVSTGTTAPQITYVLNSTSSSTPTYFFGSVAAPFAKPKSLNTLQCNIKDTLGGRQNLDISQIWMVATADFENYGASPLISQPLLDGTASIWGGRFYAYFDGRVEFVRRQTPSIYPSSHSGGFQ
ncbi:type II secretion system protein [bacterium]|nr:type II secretion system protein [bacterium]